jgi:hypothetical protein
MGPPAVTVPSQRPRSRGVFPPPGRRSVGALRRDLLAALFRQVLDLIGNARDGPFLTK